MLDRLRLRRTDGQLLVLSALALPALFAMVALVVDGADLLVHRRSIQNAADAAALAAAQDLPAGGVLCAGDPNTPGTCLYKVRTTANKYSSQNRGSNNLQWCGTTPSGLTNRDATDCYETPYIDSAGTHNDLVYVRLKKSVTTFFTSAIHLKTSWPVSARAIASANGLTTTVTTPGSTTTVVSSGTTNTFTNPGTTNVITSTTPTNTAFVYAGDTTCGAITITHGADNFGSGGIWSNGGIAASGSVNTATLVRVAGPPWQPGAPQTCTYPSAEFTDASGKPVPATLTPQRAPGDWPLALPPTPSSCTTASSTAVNSSWLGSHPAGVYCFTGTIDLQASFTGYEFVSLSSSSQAIKCSTNGLSFTGLASTPQYLFYAVNGGIALNPGNGVTLTGDTFAPKGLVVFTGGGNKVETGFIEALDVTINNGPTTFRGTGPDGGFTTTTTTVTTPGSTTTVTTPGNTTTSTTPGSTNTVITGTTIGLNE